MEQLDNEIESRHNTEILAWESTHKEEDLTNTSLVAPSDGLYDLTIGDKDEKQSKVCICWPEPKLIFLIVLISRAQPSLSRLRLIL